MLNCYQQTITFKDFEKYVCVWFVPSKKYGNYLKSSRVFALYSDGGKIMKDYVHYLLS
jgi:hypothetical protein